MRRFDYSFLGNGLLPARFVTLAASIAALKEKTGVKKVEFDGVFSQLEKVAKIQSVKSSNAIEGIVTSDDRIAAIVNEDCAPQNHNEMEIAGYRDALSIIHSNYNSLDFCEKDILRLHEVMMSFSADSLAGRYKTQNNLIIEQNENGERYVRFRPIAANETKAAMEQLELAYYDAVGNSQINQLLIIPCVILDFLCIHPFRDGNGRISRLLTLLLLYKNGYEVVRYVSFEEQINKYKDFYYDALKKSSTGWETNENSYFDFIENFLSMLYMCYKELDRRFVVINGKKPTKKTRIEACILNSPTPLSKGDICSLHPDISITTVEAVLGQMLKENMIKKVGQGRNTKYLALDNR